jgi:hypothetical protein
VVAGDAEGTRETRRPHPDWLAVDIAGTEFALGLGSIDEARAMAWRIDSTGTNPTEVPVQAERVKDVARISVPVTATL